MSSARLHHARSNTSNTCRFRLRGIAVALLLVFAARAMALPDASPSSGAPTDSQPNLVDIPAPQGDSNSISDTTQPALLHPAVAATQTYARITFVVPNEILSGYPTVALVGERGYILPSLDITRITVPLASAELPPSTNDVVPSLFTNHSICVPHDEREAVELASTDMITTQVAINDLESAIKQEPTSVPSDEQQAAGPATSAGAEATQVPEIIADDDLPPTQADRDANAPVMADVGNHDATAPQPATGCGVHRCNSRLPPCAAVEVFFINYADGIKAHRVIERNARSKRIILSEDTVSNDNICGLIPHYFSEHSDAARVKDKEPKKPQKDTKYACLFCLPDGSDTKISKPPGSIDKEHNLYRHLMSRHCKKHRYVCVMCNRGSSKTKEDAKDHVTNCHRPESVNREMDIRNWTVTIENSDDLVCVPEGKVTDKGKPCYKWPERMSRNGGSSSVGPAVPPAVPGPSANSTKKGKRKPDSSANPGDALGNDVLSTSNGKSDGGQSEQPRKQTRSKQARSASGKGKERDEDLEKEEDWRSGALDSGVLSTNWNLNGDQADPAKTKSKKLRKVSPKGKERAEDFDEEDCGASATMELDQQRDAAKKRRGGISLSGSPAKKRKTGDEPWDDDEYLPALESEATPFAPSSSSDFSLSSTEDQDQPDWRGFDIEEFLASWSPHSDGAPSSNYLPDISMQEAEFFALQQALMNGNGNQGNTAGSQDTAGMQEMAGSQETAGSLDSTGSLDTAFPALSPPKPDRPAATHTIESPRRSARHRRNGSGSGGSPLPTPSIIPGLGLLARFGANK